MSVVCWDYFNNRLLSLYYYYYKFV